MADTTTAQAWTIGRLLNWTREFLAGKAVDEPRLAAELLLSSALGCRKIELYTRFEQTPSPPQLDVFRALVQDAARHKPIAYLIGRKEFYSLEFVVGPAVLIPRPETELLVEHAISFCKSRGVESPHALDIGTGSGCVAVAIARFLPAARLVASDVSDEALAVARQNVEKHGLAERIRVVRADAAALPADARPSAGFDAIVANPPYIAESARESLPANVRDFEPAVALFGGTDGLAVIRRIATGAAVLLAPGGRLLVEVASGQDQAAASVFLGAGWRHLETVRDAAGIPRMLVLDRAA